MTGNLGNVMKESIITGLSWIRANFQHILPNPKKTDDIEGLD